MGKRTKPSRQAPEAAKQQAPAASADLGESPGPVKAPENEASAVAKETAPKAAKRLPDGIVIAKATRPNTYGGLHRRVGDVFTMSAEAFDALREAGQVEEA